MIATMGKHALNAVHGRMIFGRRVEVLAGAMARMLPGGAGSVLDLGCGDGQVAVGIMHHRPELTIEGADVLVRPVSHIKVTPYDGVQLPFAEGSFDHVTIVDVLHHTDHPEQVLAEAARVARHSVVVKDHLREGVLAGPTLRAMDWVGNRGHDVRLPYNYLDRDQWRRAFTYAGLTETGRQDRVPLYPFPLDLAFGRRLHFLVRLERASGADGVSILNQ